MAARAATTRDRFLALELAPGALAGARGLVSATGRLAPQAGALRAGRRVHRDSESAARGLTPLAWE